MKKMFLESWGTLFENWRSFLKVSLLWFGIFAVLESTLQLPTFLNPFEGPEISTRDFAIIGMMGIQLLMGFIVFPMLMVLFISSVVLKRPLPQKWFYFSFGRREWTYIFYVFLAVLFMGLAGGTSLIIAFIFQKFFPELYILSILMIAMVMFPFLYVFIRASLLAPMAACGDSEGFINSLKASWGFLRGNTLRFFTILTLGSFCAMIPFFILMVLVELFISDKIFLLGLFFIFIGKILISFLIQGFYACFLGHVYALKRPDILEVLKKIQQN